MGDRTVFNELIVCYLFLGGAGSGALVVLSGFEFFNADARTKRLPQNRLAGRIPHAFFQRCWPICSMVLLFGVLCLLVDLGRPDRMLSLFISPSISVVAVGAYSLAGAGVCSLVFMLTSLLDSFRLPAWAIRILAVLGVVCGLLASGYTGVLLQGMLSVAFWGNPLLPLLFVASSLSTGIALLFIGVSFIDSRISPARAARSLGRVDAVIIVAEMLCLAAFLAMAYADPAARSSFEALVVGEFAWLFWVGVVVCGLVVPLVMEWFLSGQNYRMQILWIAVLVLIGGLLLRVCIVGAGAYDVAQSAEEVFGVTSVMGYGHDAS